MSGPGSDGQLDRVLAAYLEAAAAGWAPSRQHVLVCYPHLADRLNLLLPDRAEEEQPTHDGAATVDAHAGMGLLTGWPEVPGYEILEEIARGGMGVVYKARQLRANRLVALKMILQGGHAGPAERARFRTDAEAIARLQHPGVVQIHEVGEHDSLPFFSMEFCAAGSLADYLDGTPLAPLEAARIVEELAGAVDACHDQGIIHRDLKPANVLLAVQNAAFAVRHPGEMLSDEEHAARRRRILHHACPKVTDFGLAKNLGASVHTASNAILGTPSYMAPEQASSQHQKLGPATDVYALGAILYECLTGRPPFKAATPVDTILQVVQDDPVPPTQLQPRIPADLERICLKCLEKDPPKRYASAQALALDLERFRRGDPVEARPLGRVSRAIRWVRRNPLVTLLLGAVVAALLLGTAVAMRFALEAEQRARDLAQAVRATEDKAEQEKLARQEVVRTSQEVERARRLADERLLRSEWLVYAGQIALAQREWDSGNAALAWLHLGSSRKDFRGWEYRYLVRQFTHNQRTFPDSAPLTCVTWSPGGETIAAGNQDRTVTLWNARTGAVTAVLQGHKEGITCLAFSPDGKLLATASTDQTIKVWKIGTEQLLFTFTGHEGKVTSLAFRPDGKRLVSSSEDRSVRVWNIEPLGNDPTTWKENPPREVVSLNLHSAAVTAVAFTPTGNLLASGGLDGTIRLWDAQQFQLNDSIKDAGGPVTCLAFSPDGRHLASGCRDRVRIWDAHKGQPVLPPLRAQGGAVLAVAFSRDGNHLVTTGQEPLVRVWAAKSGELLFALKGHAAPVRTVACHPEGRFLATASLDRTVKVWDLAQGEEMPVRGHHGAIKHLALHRDGKTLVTAGADGTVRTWDVPSGKATASQTGHVGAVHAVALNPDASLVASGGEDMTLRLWQVTTGQLVRAAAREHTAAITCLRFSPDGQRLATASLDRTVKMWHGHTGQLLSSFRAHTDGVTCLAFSPDGTYLATTSLDGSAKLWHAGKRWLIRTFWVREEPLLCLAFSPDGQRLAIGGSDHLIRVFAVDSGKLLAVLRGHTGIVTTLAFRPDGTRLASGGEDRTVRLWATDIGQEVLALRGHGEEVTSLAFSRDGNTLASASDDGSVRFWHASASTDTSMPAPLLPRDLRRRSPSSPGGGGERSLTPPSADTGTPRSR